MWLLIPKHPTTPLHASRSCWAAAGDMSSLTYRHPSGCSAPDSQTEGKWTLGPGQGPRSRHALPLLFCKYPSQNLEDPRRLALRTWPAAAGRRKELGTGGVKGACRRSTFPPNAPSIHPRSDLPPRLLPSSSSRPQSPPSSRGAGSLPHAPARRADCRRGTGRESAPFPSAGCASPVGSVRPAVVPREGATFLRSRDISGTTWKTSLGWTAGMPGIGGRGCRRSLAGPGCPRTS